MTRTAAVAATAVLAISSAQRNEVHAAEKLIYATYISEAYTASKAVIWMMKEIEKRSGGEIKFESYWSNALLKAPDLFPGLRSGAADIVLGAPHAYNVKEYPLANVVMPFLSTKPDAVTRAWNDLYAANGDFRKEFESRGGKVLFSLGWAENTIWSKKPIAKVDDFKGLKVRAVPTISDALQKLGATPVALAWADGLEGLQRGIVDAMSSAPFDSAVLGAAHEVAKHGTEAGGMGVFAVATIAIGLNRYNKLSEKHRKIIDEVAAETPVQGMKLLEENMDASVAKLCAMKEKLNVHIFPPSEVEKVHQLAASSMQSDWIKRAETEAKADGKAMLAQFVGLLREHEKAATYVGGFERYLNKCGKS